MAEIAQYRRPAPNTQPEYRCESYMSTHKRSPSHPLILMPQTLSEAAE